MLPFIWKKLYMSGNPKGMCFLIYCILFLIILKLYCIKQKLFYTKQHILKNIKPWNPNTAKLIKKDTSPQCIILGRGILDNTNEENKIIIYWNGNFLSNLIWNLQETPKFCIKCIIQHANMGNTMHALAWWVCMAIHLTLSPKGCPENLPK